MTTDHDLHIEVNGERLLLDRSGAAYWPAERTLVFADLHFEKGSAMARRGSLLPPYDTRSTIRRMEQTIARFAPTRVIALGDSFHDGEADARLDAEERAMLTALAARGEWIWVEGNHDPKPPAWIGGIVASQFARGGLVFRHLPTAQSGEVAGHLHPAATVTRRGTSVRRRCFVSDGARLLLPAFGAYAGGLDVRDEAIASLFAGGCTAYALGRERVYAVHALRRNRNDDIQPSSTAIRTVERP
ncbi:MAG: ligase-associated DNA damage response endonuclease PdeM [Alphaproteobacteria bacterium]|nr:ligase-associated DNA damage response endonuclease PdeM [Alphaproteobacteria bacterium]MDE2265734.1 ligase-associated DNA damage response endonuclease PdeM [Alphaproteobacteria bacterium]MDE2498864.1 ligase-associated DNA damage response endonuclease PdeM [Alphaproteobacteria bacterium]